MSERSGRCATSFANLGSPSMAEMVEVRNRCASTGMALPRVPGGGRRAGAKETRAIALNKVTVRCRGARGVIDVSPTPTRSTAGIQALEMWRVDGPSRHGVVPPTRSRSSFAAPSHVPGFAPRLPVATPMPVSETGTRRRTKGKRTTLRKHIFSSFLSLLHPPVHLRQLSAWQASRAWKNSLQTTGLGVNDGRLGGTEGGRTEPVGLLGMHAW